MLQPNSKEALTLRRVCFEASLPQSSLCQNQGKACMQCAQFTASELSLMVRLMQKCSIHVQCSE
jgi:hypothetical protein